MADILRMEEVDSIVKDSPTRVALFAYGTLRPDHALHGIVDVVDAEPGNIYGHSLYHLPGAGYPHMVQDGGGGVRGDLLWVMPNSRLLEAVRMEMRAGYGVKVVNVYTAGLEEATPAISFVYPHIPWGAECVATGDWKDVEVTWSPRVPS